jgi:hypothetical protein
MMWCCGGHARDYAGVELVKVAMTLPPIWPKTPLKSNVAPRVSMSEIQNYLHRQRGAEGLTSSA